MHALLRVVTFLVTSGALSACGAPAAPSPQSPLSLTAQASKTTLASGETATVTFTLQNVSKSSIRIDSPDACVLLPYVFDRRATKLVEDAGIGCAQVVTSFDLPPGSSRTLEITIRAGDERGSFIALPSGEYWIYAKLHDAKYALQSAPLTIVIS